MADLKPIQGAVIAFLILGILLSVGALAVRQVQVGQDVDVLCTGANVTSFNQTGDRCQDSAGVVQGGYSHVYNSTQNSQLSFSNTTNQLPTAGTVFGILAIVAGAVLIIGYFVQKQK